MNNGFYGKTFEKLRKRLNLDFLDKLDTHRILNRQLNYLSMIKVRKMKNLICIHLIRNL